MLQRLSFGGRAGKKKKKKKKKKKELIACQWLGQSGRAAAGCACTAAALRC
jgi:hypothetical protein